MLRQVREQQGICGWEEQLGDSCLNSYECTAVGRLVFCDEKLEDWEGEDLRSINSSAVSQICGFTSLDHRFVSKNVRLG